MVSTPAVSSEDTNNLRFMEHLPLGSGPERDPNVVPKLEHHFKGGGSALSMPRLLTKANDGASFGKHRRQAAEVTSETYRVGHRKQRGYPFRRLSRKISGELQECRR